MTSQNARPTTSTSSILDLLSKDNRAQLAKAHLIVDDKKAASAQAFNTRQLELALGAPVLNTDRKDGGVDGYARELAIELVNNWSVAVKTETATRFANAKATLVNALFEKTKAAALAAGASEEEAFLKAGNKVTAIKGVLYNADKAAHKAVDYAFKVIDEENKAKKAPANAS